MIQIDYHEDGKPRRFVFTGDLGRRNMGLLPDPTVVKNIDILVTESTYGNRELDPYDKLIKQLHAIVARATRLQSKVVIPAFSLGRTQRMVYCLQELFTIHKVRPDPRLRRQPAGDASDRHPPRPPRGLHPAGAQADGQGPDVLRLEVRRVLRDLGRLAAAQLPARPDGDHRLVGDVRGGPHPPPPPPRRRATPITPIVIVSYQAEGTLGRKLAEGVERVQIMDQWYDLNAAVYVLDGFSGHADRNDLAWWFEQTGGGIEHGFLVHGEPEAMAAIAPIFRNM